MTRHRRAFLYGAIACALVDLVLITLIALRLHWFTWAATPAGKATVVAGMFVALVAVLIYLAVRTERRDRAKREAQEEADYDEWEARLRAEDDLSMAEWRRQLRLEAEMLDAEVRRVTDQERRVEADRLDQNTWPLPLSPRVVDQPWAAAQPMPPRYWLGESKPIAEAQSYAGAAAWFGSDMRAGVDVSDGVIDAIVPVSGGPRHAWGSVRGTDTQRRDPAFTAWEENTGAWPVVTRELAGASS